MALHFTSCPLCEATCGVVVETEGSRVVSVRGDDADPFSRGYICPKATALADLHHDPDRLTKPLRRDGERWHEIEWDEAFDHVAERLRAVRAAHGKDAVGIYQGNPTVHNLGLVTLGQLALRSFGTHNMYSATSNDQLPHMLAALQMFGHQILMPVPDLDHCDLLICIGANPLASNGSIMTAPDMRSRLKQIQARGGKVIVLDPRRTETAERADRHLFIRPGTDAVFLLALAHELFATGAARLGRLAPHVRGEAELRRAAAAWSPERAAAITGIAAAELRELAGLLATTPRAALYGRVGLCTQEFGGLAAWLLYAVNAVTGHLDEPGGLMFTTPALDPIPIAGKLGYDGGFARWHSRVSHKPEFGGELPMSVFAEEIATPGEGQIRALITCAGNPVLSSPGGPNLERALAGLDFMVSIDPYLNETTRFAHVVLPPASPLERSHYDAALFALSVRNVAKYSPAVFERPADARHDWEICLALWTRMRAPRWLGGLAERVVGKLGPEALLDAALRLGPWGLRRGRAGLTLDKLRAAPHGVDLGALTRRLPERLNSGVVELAPAVYLADLPRLAARFDRPADGLVMIGRRHLRSNNSWMHNSERLVKGPPRCTLMIHPSDAAARGLVEGGTATVATTRGSIALPVEITDTMMPGVVSVPHGWGHHRNTRLRVANANPGESLNDILDPALTDQLSGTSALNGQPVEVSCRAEVP
ncbi:MAG: molybdopterin oxidoreductase family protein [Kofleriaceae bacterium]